MKKSLKYHSYPELSPPHPVKYKNINIKKLKLKNKIEKIASSQQCKGKRKSSIKSDIPVYGFPYDKKISKT